MSAIGRFALSVAVAVSLLFLAGFLEVVAPVSFGHHFWTYMAGWLGGSFTAHITRRSAA